jgi:2-methylisocitrate lyase-like PEP mutase family enzyme
MGYALAIFPGVCLASAIAACNLEVKMLKETGRQRDYSEWKQSFDDLNDWLKAPFYLELENRYRS